MQRFLFLRGFLLTMSSSSSSWQRPFPVTDARTMSFVLGMRVSPDFVPKGTVLEDYVQDLHSKCEQMLSAAQTLAAQVPQYAEVPHPQPQTVYPYLVALKTGWTLDVREDFVRVGSSPVHGRGVFAVKALDVGMLVTTYPVHAVFVQPSKEEKKESGLPSQEVVLTPDNQPLPDAHVLSPYRMKLDEWSSFAGDPRIHAPHACGHLMNDARKTEYAYNVSVLSLLGGAVNVVVVIAPVAAGEELFFDYGKGYWGET